MVCQTAMSLSFYWLICQIDNWLLDCSIRYMNLTKENITLIFRLAEHYPRRDQVADIDMCVEIERECFPPGQGYSDERCREVFNNSPDNHIYMICRDLGPDRSVVGNLWVEPGVDKTYIASIAVLPKYRGFGIGKAALEEILARYNAPYHLHVSTDNKLAIQLYEKYGFTIDHTAKAWYASGNDAYYMIKQGRKLT